MLSVCTSNVGKVSHASGCQHGAACTLKCAHAEHRKAGWDLASHERRLCTAPTYDVAEQVRLARQQAAAEMLHVGEMDMEVVVAGLQNVETPIIVSDELRVLCIWQSYPSLANACAVQAQICRGNESHVQIVKGMRHQGVSNVV